MNTYNYATLRARFDDEIAHLQIYRPEANNTINEQLIADFTAAIDICDVRAKIVVVEGLPDVFCFGADFNELQQSFNGTVGRQQNPQPMYALWRRLAAGPYVSIAHVRGKANAGGMGFVAACDIVLAEAKALFSLSELLFGLLPACVLPFLIRRIGFAKANYMTMSTQPVTAQQAHEWGLVDAYEENSENLLRKNLLRLRRLNKASIARCKRYLHSIEGSLDAAEHNALAANRNAFSDIENLQKIACFVQTGRFPWESAA